MHLQNDFIKHLQGLNEKKNKNNQNGRRGKKTKMISLIFIFRISLDHTINMWTQLNSEKDTQPRVKLMCICRKKKTTLMCTMAGRRTCVINLLFLYHYQLIFILFCSIWQAYVFVLIMYSLHMCIQYNMSTVIALESRQYNGIYNNKYER